jgi:hypothetical protein
MSELTPETLAAMKEALRTAPLTQWYDIRHPEWAGAHHRITATPNADWATFEYLATVTPSLAAFVTVCNPANVSALIAERDTLADQVERQTEENRQLLAFAVESCNGCGKPINGWPNVFRCVSCDRKYHRECLLTHCAKETADITAERDRLKEDLRILTKGQFVHG